MPTHTAETHACSVLRISRDFLIYYIHATSRVAAKTLGVYFLAWRNAHGFPENYIILWYTDILQRCIIIYTVHTQTYDTYYDNSFCRMSVVFYVEFLSRYILYKLWRIVLNLWPTIIQLYKLYHLYNEWLYIL